MGVPLASLLVKGKALEGKHEGERGGERGRAGEDTSVVLERKEEGRKEGCVEWNVLRYLVIWMLRE